MTRLFLNPLPTLRLLICWNVSLNFPLNKKYPLLEKTPVIKECLPNFHGFDFCRKLLIPCVTTTPTIYDRSQLHHYQHYLLTTKEPIQSSENYYKLTKESVKCLKTCMFWRYVPWRESIGGSWSGSCRWSLDTEDLHTAAPLLPSAAVPVPSCCTSLPTQHSFHLLWEKCQFNNKWAMLIITQITSKQFF